MNLHLNVMVQQTMADLIAAYELSVVEVSESEVLLKSQNYFIDVFAGKEGVGVVYFDKMSRPVKGYNLFLYLVNRRRGLLVFSESQTQAESYTEFIENQLASLARHLRTAGQDILGGAKDWIKEYSWPTVFPDQVVNQHI